MRASYPLLLALLAVVHVPVARAADGAASGLTLRCTPAEAQVFIDGDAVGKTPLPKLLPLPVGEHTVRVSRPGYTPYIDVFKVKSGQGTTLDVELVPISGVLRVTAESAGVRIFVDEKYVGDAPLETELTVGSHGVRGERPGFFPETFTISAVAGQVIERAVNLSALPADQNPYLRKPAPPPRWYQKWWVWTIGAVGVAVVATAIIVPVVLSRRDVCDGLDICVRNVGTTQQGLGVSVAF